MSGDMSQTKDRKDSDFNDAIELMFFAYRDFIADPDVILEAHDFGRAHHRVLHFVAGNPGISIADLLDILRVTKQSLARVLRDLIDGDYVEQRIGANDRRKRLLHLNLWPNRRQYFIEALFLRRNQLAMQGDTFRR